MVLGAPVWSLSLDWLLLEIGYAIQNNWAALDSPAKVLDWSPQYLPH